MKIPFSGRVLLLGCGSVSQCLQPLLLKHLDMDFSQFTVMDMLDYRDKAADLVAAGAQFVQHQITPANLDETLATYLGKGDLLIDLAWSIEVTDIVQWCHDHDVLYVNTATELWDAYDYTISPKERTLYVRHMMLREMRDKWTRKGTTAVVEHGANPGLVSHWTKVALTDITTAMFNQGVNPHKHAALQDHLTKREWNHLAHLLGVKVIHISERDTQISNQPKQVNEFVNTWSVEGLYEEGIAPAEMGWGTHERILPRGAMTYDYGPANQICLSQMGIETYVRSWVPIHGEIMGMVVRHGEAFTISDHLTVRDHKGHPVYRPTVHYAYHPSNEAIVSLWELKMRNYEMQPAQRIMNDEIIDGMDELGVLLLGHDLNGWWTGSQLDIHEARKLVPGQNATTLQVAAAVLGAVAWMVKNPDEGLCVADDLPHEDVLSVANLYLGPCPSVQTDWTPMANRKDIFSPWNGKRLADEDVWQFETFLVK
ncbi:MAG: saccharopine dehydrogenase NADP-binding domain-containing protein [Anaerolineae bacterium]|nr:saccharopine dehydrogenase NADP-binding domain-containing protein [Anaerolineae bacterium]